MNKIYNCNDIIITQVHTLESTIIYLISVRNCCKHMHINKIFKININKHVTLQMQKSRYFQLYETTQMKDFVNWVNKDGICFVDFPLCF